LCPAQPASQRHIVQGGWLCEHWPDGFGAAVQVVAEQAGGGNVDLGSGDLGQRAPGERQAGQGSHSGAGRFEGFAALAQVELGSSGACLGPGAAESEFAAYLGAQRVWVVFGLVLVVSRFGEYLSDRGDVSQ
jgi:hypothetical protein